MVSCCHYPGVSSLYALPTSQTIRAERIFRHHEVQSIFQPDGETEDIRGHLTRGEFQSQFVVELPQSSGLTSNYHILSIEFLLNQHILILTLQLWVQLSPFCR